MRLLAYLVVALLVLFLGISWFLSNIILTPNGSVELTQQRIRDSWGGVTAESILAKLPPPTNIEFKTFDGITLRGKYFAKQDTVECVIIGAHGWTSDWIGMLKYAPTLEDCMCDLLFYDHRGHGDSDDAYPTAGINEAKDLLGLTEWVQKEKGLIDQQIGWMGASWGGATVLQAGAAKKNVGFIISDASFQDWYSAIFERAVRDYGSWTKIISSAVMQLVNVRAGINYKDASPLLAAKQIEEPVLLIHSKMDEQTGSHQSVNISKNLNAQSEFHHLTWGGGHTRDALLHKDQFKDLITNFLKRVHPEYVRINKGDQI